MPRPRSAASRSAMRSSTSSSPIESRSRPGLDAARRALLVGAADVRGRGGVQHERAHVAEVGHAGEQLQRVGERAGPPRGRRAAVNGEHRALAVAAGTARRARGTGWRPVRCSRREATSGCSSSHSASGEGVRGLVLHPQRQRLDALQDEERVERRGRRAVAHGHAPGERRRTRSAPARSRWCVRRRPDRTTRCGYLSGWSPQSKRAGVDDDAAEHRAVAGEELARRVHDDVGAVLDRTQRGTGWRACCRSTSGTPWRCATAATAAMSSTSFLGFGIDSASTQSGRGADRGIPGVGSLRASATKSTVDAEPARLSRRRSREPS